MPAGADAWFLGNATMSVLRVTAKDCGAGFFALMIYAMNQIIWADANGYASYIHFGKRCRDGRPNRYYDEARGPNMWDYYFSPVSHGVVSTPVDLQLTGKQLFHLHHTSTASVQTYPHGVHRHLKLPRWRYHEPWHRMMRERASTLLRQRVHLHPSVLETVRSFYRERVLALGHERPILGVHLRGTDKLRNIGGRIVQPKEYSALIEHYLERRPQALLFVATDSPKFLKALNETYVGRIVVYNALRSERNAFADTLLDDNYKKGEDALVDALLLSCANVLLKPASALSEFAVYWNTGLHNHTYEMQYEEGLPTPVGFLNRHLASGRDRLRGFDRCAEVLRE